MTVYEAIEKMRSLTKMGIPFSFSYMTYSQDKNFSDGPKTVNRAKLRPGTNKINNAFSEIMLNYIDLDTDEPRQFYQPLLMTFNGQILELK